MAEGTFQIQADITPVFDTHAAEQQAAKLSQLIQDKMAKSIKVTPAIDTPGVAKHVQAVTKAQDQATASLKRQADEAQKTSGVFSRMGDALAGVGSKVSSISGSTRTLITNNQRLKASYKEVSASTGAIANLPKEFGKLQASVLSGSSAMDKAAKSGDHFALSMLPFLRLGTIMARDLDSAGFSLRGLDKNLKILTNHLVPISQQVPSSFRKMLDATQEFDKRSNFQKAREGIRGLKEDIGDLSRPAPDQEKFLTAVFGSEPGIINGLKRIKQRIKDAFSKGGGIVEPTQLNLFDAAAAQRQATQTAKVAADAYTGGVSARIKDKSGGTLKLFDPDVVTKEAKKTAEATSSILQSSMGSGKTASLLKDSGGKAGTGWFRSFIDRVKKGLKDDTGSAQLLGMGGSIITGPFKALGKVAGAASSPIKSLTGALGGLGTGFGGVQAAATAAMAALVAVTSFGVSAAIKLETLNTALRGIFGDQALQAFADLNRFASQTPFTLESATSSVIKLASAFDGLDPSQAIQMLKPLASAAAAIGASEESIQRATTGIVQIGAAGVTTADNLRQVTEALPNVSKTAIIQHLAKNMNQTESAARSMLLNGLVPANEGIRAILESARDARGATDSLSKQANTLSGRFSTLKDNLTVLAGITFAPLAAGLSQLLKGINASFTVAFQLLRNLADLGSHLPKVGGRFAEMRDQIDAATSSLNAHSGAAADAIPNVDALALAIGRLQNASGFSGQLSALSGVIGAFNTKADETATKIGTALDKILALKPALDAVSNAQKAAKDAQQSLNDAITRHNKELADQRVQLTEAATAATDRLTAAQEGLAAATEALREAQEGASPEELERADIALAEAKLRLLQLDEDAKVAVDALNKSTEKGLGLQKTSLDLTGLTVDQIKTRLSTVRASLKAQKDAQKDSGKATEETGKSAAQIAIDAHQAELDRRSAILDVKDAEQAVQDTKAKGTALDDAVIEATKNVLEATKARDAALKEQGKSQAALNDLSKTDQDYQKEIGRLTEARNEATGKIAEAEKELQIARASAVGDQQLVNSLKGEEILKNITLLDQAKKLGESGANAAKQQLTTILPALLQGTKTVHGGIGVTPNQTLIDLISRRILESPGSDLRNILKMVLASLGLTVPGLKSGGLVQGVPGAMGTLRRLGEYGQSELVLPLNDVQRSSDLLARYAPTISLAGARKAGTSLPLSASPLSPVSGGTRRRATSEREARKERDALAKAIAHALTEAGFNEKGDQNFNFTVEAAPNAQLSEVALKRAVERAIGL